MSYLHEVAGEFLIDFMTCLADADQEARAPLVWTRLLPMLGHWYAHGAPFAAALWLADDEEGHRYTLWLAHNSLEKERTPQPYCVSLTSQSLARDKLQAAFHAQRDEWVSPRFRIQNGGTVAIPLQYSMRTDHGVRLEPQTLGAVSLYGAFRGSQTKASELEVVASIAGSWLRLNREARITCALGELQSRCQDAVNSTALAKHIGEILRVHVSAHVKWQILVPNGADLVELAGWENSRNAPESPWRIRLASPLHQFHFDPSADAPDRAILRFDAKGRPKEATGLDGDVSLKELTGLESDGETVTALIQRVRDRTTSKGGTRPPVVATFLLVSGPTNQFVGGLFSRTNLRILDHIADYFRSSYAVLLEREAMGDINDIIVKFSPAPDIMEEEADVAHLRAFARVTREVLPSVTEAVIVERRHEPRFRESYYRSDGMSGIRPPWLVQDSPLGKIVNSKANPDRFIFQKLVRGNGRTAKSFHLALELSSGSLSLVEETLLERIVAEILATMNLHLDQEKWAVQLAEVRHNLRSVVMSLLGKTEKITEGFEAARSASPAVAYDRLFQRARFHKAIRQLKYAGEELRALTENIRTITGGAKRIVLQVSSVDLHEMISDCLGLFTEEMERRDLTCALDNQLPYALRVVDGDRAWLHILFFNLIENAVKYSRQRGRIELRLWPHGPFWRFSVTNIGKHIPPHMRRVIFDPYIRLDPEPGEQAMPGTGIGLASIKRIAELHQVPGMIPPYGAAVMVSSELIGGDSRLRTARTVFTISLPRKLGGGTIHA